MKKILIALVIGVLSGVSLVHADESPPSGGGGGVGPGGYSPHIYYFSLPLSEYLRMQSSSQFFVVYYTEYLQSLSDLDK